MTRLFSLILFSILASFLTVSAQEQIKINLNGQDAMFPDAFRRQGIPLGDVFPVLELTDIEGKSLDFDPEKIYVVNFWFVGCTGCKQEEPFLKQLSGNFHGNEKVEFIGLCMSKESKIERYFLKREQFGFRTFSIGRKEVQENYNVRMSPSHMIVQNGKVAENITIPIADHVTLKWYKDRIQALLDQNPK
jgi:thiol-disulfide isomerase/thioredoxin